MTQFIEHSLEVINSDFATRRSNFEVLYFLDEVINSDFATWRSDFEVINYLDEVIYFASEVIYCFD